MRVHEQPRRPFLRDEERTARCFWKTLGKQTAHLRPNCRVMMSVVKTRKGRMDNSRLSLPRTSRPTDP
jgi:hypothetical protein